MKRDDLRRELASADDALAAYKDNAPTDLVDRRRSLQEQLDQVVYPVAELPTEITQEIFENLIPRAPTTERWWDNLGGDLSPTAAPLLLMHVCSTWRAIALALPSLWAVFGIFFDGPDNGPPMELFDRWFTLICPSPSSLTLKGNMTSTEAAHLEAVLRRHAPHVVDLRISLDDIDMEPLREPLPMHALRRLYLENGGRNIPANMLLRAFANATALAEIVFFYGTRPLHFALPWAQLTSITSDGWTAMECLKAIVNCPQLKKVVFTEVFPIRIPLPHMSIIHPVLEGFSCAPLPHQFYPILHFPALQSLATLHAPPPPLEYFLPNFVARFSTTLTNLFYSADYVSGDDPISVAWFEIMHALERISLMHPPETFTREFLLRLDRAVHPQFLPRLRQLVVRKQTLVVDLPVVKSVWSRAPCPSYGDFCRADGGTESSPETPAMNSLPTLHAFVLIRHPFPPGGDRTAVGAQVDWDALADLAYAVEDNHGWPKMALHVGSEAQSFIVDWDGDSDGDGEDAGADEGGEGEVPGDDEAPNITSANTEEA